MKLLNHKKGALDQLTGIAIGLVTFCIVVVIAALIAANVASNTQVAADANATATATEVQTQIGSLADWLGIIIVAAVGSAILGLVMMCRRR